VVGNSLRTECGLKYAINIPKSLSPAKECVTSERMMLALFSHGQNVCNFGIILAEGPETSDSKQPFPKTK